MSAPNESTPSAGRLITVSDLVLALRSGQRFDIEFAVAVEEQEGYAQAGMRGRIQGFSEEDDNLFVISVNLEPFDAHNDALARTDYFDKSGQPTLTGKQAGYYPKDHIERVWVGGDDEIARYFTVLDASRAALYARYQAERGEQSYVQWLEAQVLNEGNRG